jgi:hypothetical protein
MGLSGAIRRTRLSSPTVTSIPHVARQIWQVVCTVFMEFPLEAAFEHTDFGLQTRLASQHFHPTAATDAVTAYRWLLAEDDAPRTIANGGDLAGGGSCLATALVRLRDEGLPKPSTAVFISRGNELIGRDFLFSGTLAGNC